MNIDAWYESRLEINKRLAEFDIDIWEEDRVRKAEEQEDAITAKEEQELIDLANEGCIL